MARILAYSASAIVALWGLAHAIPTRQVLAGFEPTSQDNRRVVLQEWLAESLAMWGLAAFVVTATAVGRAGDPSAVWVYRTAAVVLAALALLTSLTGARTAVVWFRICPVVQLVAAGLLVAASLA